MFEAVVRPAAGIAYTPEQKRPIPDRDKDTIPDDKDACPDVPGEVLNPKNTWKDKKAYDSAARDVAQRFEKNFQQFEGHVDDKVNKSAIRAAA